MTTASPPRKRTSLKPFTLEHFRAYTSNIVLDNGGYWELEDFQCEIVEPILAGVPETWVIIPEGNGKTSLMAGVALYFCDYQIQPWIPIAASSRDQAEILAQQAYQMIRASPGMRNRFRIYEGYRKIMPIRKDHPGPGSRGIKVYPADVTSGDGVIPTLALCDEGHRWPDMRLYRLWKGKLNKRKGQIVMISTAGEPGGDFENSRDAIRSQLPEKTLKVAHLHAYGPRMAMHEWRVEKPDDIANMAKVKDANPLSIITEETLGEEFSSPMTDLGDWRRLKCNIPSRTVNAAITETEWLDAQVRKPRDKFLWIPKGERIDVGVDVAWKHDTFAIVPLWANQDYRLLGKPIILEPPRDGSSMHPDVVKAAFLDLSEQYEIDAAVIDMERAEDIAAWLEDELEVTVIDRPQGNSNAAQDYDSFMEGLRNGRLKHTGDKGLESHALNAIARSLPSDKKRFDRPSQSRARKKQSVRVIDALTAAAMVNQYVDSYVDLGEPLVAWG